MKKSKIIKITRIAIQLSFIAVIADLFYIITRLSMPVTTIDDAAFVYALPDMLKHMLLCVAIITAFMAVMTRITAEQS